MSTTHATSLSASFCLIVQCHNNSSCAYTSNASVAVTQLIIWCGRGQSHPNHHECMRLRHGSDDLDQRRVIHRARDGNFVGSAPVRAHIRLENLHYSRRGCLTRRS